MPHGSNFSAGWCLILAAFVSGAIIGLGFHRDEYLGGYSSYRRRLLRLGHVALAALGILNVVYGLSPVLPGPGFRSVLPGALLIAGAIAMPLVCFLSAWRTAWRHLFFVPVGLLATSVVLILLAGLP